MRRISYSCMTRSGAVFLLATAFLAAPGCGDGTRQDLQRQLLTAWAIGDSAKDERARLDLANQALADATMAAIQSGQSDLLLQIAMHHEDSNPPGFSRSLRQQLLLAFCQAGEQERVLALLSSVCISDWPTPAVFIIASYYSGSVPLEGLDVVLDARESARSTEVRECLDHMVQQMFRNFSPGSDAETLANTGRKVLAEYRLQLIVNPRFLNEYDTRIGDSEFPLLLHWSGSP